MRSEKPIKRFEMREVLAATRAATAVDSPFHRLLGRSGLYGKCAELEGEIRKVFYLSKSNSRHKQLQRWEDGSSAIPAGAPRILEKALQLEAGFLEREWFSVAEVQESARKGWQTGTNAAVEVLSQSRRQLSKARSSGFSSIPLDDPVPESRRALAKSMTTLLNQHGVDIIILEGRFLLGSPFSSTGGSATPAARTFSLPLGCMMARDYRPARSTPASLSGRVFDTRIF